MPWRCAQHPQTGSSASLFPAATTQRTYRPHITGTGVELMGARQHMIIAARAAGVQCLDTVFTNLDDMDGFEQET